jgi:hypothetical protein
MFRSTPKRHYGKAGLRGLAIFFLGTLPLAATNYFVRPTGNDAATGTSINAAWQTIERVNRARFQPGDTVQFEAGTTFPGNLVLSAEDAGTSNAPVVIGSFGEGRATILAGGQTGIAVQNAGGITIENLIVAGAGRTNNAGYGICCDNTLTDGRRLGFLRIANVEARGFGIFGILVAGTRAGFEHVLITNCVMRDNLRGGMEVAGRLPWDSTVYAHADVHVCHCQAFDNSGDPTYLKNHSSTRSTAASWNIAQPGTTAPCAGPAAAASAFGCAPRATWSFNIARVLPTEPAAATAAALISTAAVWTVCFNTTTAMTTTVPA